MVMITLQVKMRFKYFMFISLLPTFVLSDLDRWSPIINGKGLKSIAVKHQNNITSLFAISSTLDGLILHDVKFEQRAWISDAKQLVFHENGDAWMIKSASGHLFLTAGSITKEINDTRISIAAGRKGLLLTADATGHAYLRTGITTSIPEGTAWQAISGSHSIVKVACARDICFGVDTDGRMFSTGFIPATPTDVKWMSAGTNVKQISANGQNTIWKIDKNGHTWEAVNVFDRNALKINWERRGFHNTVFQDIAVSDRMAFAFPSQEGTLTMDSSIRVRTGCPIFDFEDEDLSSWTAGCDIRSKGKADHCDTATEGEKHFSCYNGDIATVMSPVFEIRHDMLHFLVGGGYSTTNYVALVINNAVVRKASGKGSYKGAGNGGCALLTRWWWDVKEYKHQCARIKIVDNRNSWWGSTSFDDLRTSPPCFKGMEAEQTKPLQSYYHVGASFYVTIKLRNFFVSKLRPLTIKASAPVVNGSTLVFFTENNIQGRRCDTKVQRRSSFNTTNTTHSYTVKFTELLEDAELRLTLMINDHDYFPRPTSQTNLTLTISVNFADEYLRRWNQSLTVKRTGNEKAQLNLASYQEDSTFLNIGNNFWVQFSFSHVFPYSHHRAYNVLINVYARPLFKLEHISGLKPTDIVESLDPSHHIVKIPELMLRTGRSIRFYLQITADTTTKRKVQQILTEDVLVDIAYCIRPRCMNVHNNITEVVWLAQNAIFTTKYQSAVVSKDKATSMNGFTTIFDKSELLVFICGPYKQRNGKHRRNCYYANATSDAWTGLNSMISNITCYDAAQKTLYGTNEDGINMKIFGDTFESTLFLSNDEWQTTVDNISCSMPVYVKGNLNDFNPMISPNITLTGKDNFRYAVNSYGGSSKGSSTVEWKAKNKWLCCP